MEGLKMVKDKASPVGNSPFALPTRASRSRLLKLLIILVPALVYLLRSHLPNSSPLLGRPRIPFWDAPLTPSQVFVHELAATMEEFYGMLVHMQYLKPEAVSHAPHTNPGINVTLALELKMSPEAIMLLQILPYVQTTDPYYLTAENASVRFGTAANVFMMGTTFADFRNDDELRASRDPWQSKYGIYEDVYFEGDSDGDEGEYMKPWQVVLTGTPTSSTYEPFVAVNLANGEERLF
jgi:hypothetical protein